MNFRPAILLPLGLGLSWALLLSPAPLFPALTPEQQATVNRNLDQAFGAFMDGNYETALNMFEAVLKVDPKDFTAKNGARQCREKMKETRDVKPGSPSEPISLQPLRASEVSLDSVEDDLKEENWIDAIDGFHTLALRQANDRYVPKLRAKINAAIKKKIVGLEIGSPEHLGYRGLLAYLDKRDDEAVQLWKQALQIVLAQDAKLEIWIQRGQQALDDKNNMLNLNLLRNQAQTASDAKKYPEAIKLWRQVLDKKPGDEGARIELGRLRGMVQDPRLKALAYVPEPVLPKPVPIPAPKPPVPAAPLSKPAATAAQQAKPSAAAASAPAKGGREEETTAARQKYLIKKYIEEGKAAYKKKLYGDSLKCWQAILAIDPGNSKARSYLRKLDKINFQAPAQGAEPRQPPAAVKAAPAKPAAPVPPSPRAAADARNQALIQTYARGGVAAYQREDFIGAYKLWKAVLALDPDNATAREYLAKMKQQGFEVIEPSKPK